MEEVCHVVKEMHSRPTDHWVLFSTLVLHIGFSFRLFVCFCYNRDQKFSVCAKVSAFFNIAISMVLTYSDTFIFILLLVMVQHTRVRRQQMSCIYELGTVWSIITNQYSYIKHWNVDRWKIRQSLNTKLKHLDMSGAEWEIVISFLWFEWFGPLMQSSFKV